MSLGLEGVVFSVLCLSLSAVLFGQCRILSHPEVEFLFILPFPAVMSFTCALRATILLALFTDEGLYRQGML